jgi:REP element-mobilizing transposase RayT
MGGGRYRSGIEGPALLFVTTSTDGKVNIFDSDEKLSLLEEALFKVVRLQKSFLMGYVLMPNHLHLLIGSPSGGNHISALVHSLKGNVRKAIFGDRRIWQQRFDDLVIKTEEQFRIKLD